MRTFFTTIFILTAVFSYCQNAQVKIRQISDSETIKIYFQADEEKKVSVFLRSGTGKILFTENLRTNAFIKPYYLQNLPDGEYRFQVSHGGELIEKEFVLGDQQLAVHKEKKQRRQKSKKKDKVMLAFEDASDLKISLLDPEMKAVSIFFYLGNSDEFEYFYWEPSTTLERSYDLSRFDNDEIRVEIVENGKIVAEKAIARNW